MDEPPPIRILLIGPSGQLGWELLKVLPTLGRGVALGRGQMDLADPDAIRDRLAGVEADIIVNAAAYTDVDRAETDIATAEKVNAVAPGVIAEQARALGAALIHFSTDFVFDGALDRPYTPDDTPNPINAYGRTKLDGERAVLASGAAALILRVGWLYSRRRRNFLVSILEQAKQGRPIRVVDDRFGGPTWARTVADAAARIIGGALAGGTGYRHFDGREGIYHVAATGMTSRHGFARRILELAKIPNAPKVTAVKSDAYPTPAPRPAFTVLDTQRTCETFGLEFPAWDAALEEAINDPFASESEPIFLGLRAAG